MHAEQVAQKINDIAGAVIRFSEAAWNKPYTKEMLIVLGVLLALLFIARTIRKRYAPIRLFNNSAGVVTVTPKALDELVQSVCYSMGALNRPSVKVSAKRGRLSLVITLKLEMGQKLSEVSAAIQEEMISALREHLGVEKLGSIDVRIKGFRGILRKPAPAAFKAIDDIEKAEDGKDSNNPFSPTHL